MEAQRIWDQYKTDDDDVLTAADASPEIIAHTRNLVGRVLKVRGASRFLCKYPRLSLRLQWLDAVFSDALFIHLTRDWRSVVSSMVQWRVKREKRGGGWFGIFIPGWREMEDLSHVLASARIFRFVNQVLEKEADRLGDRFLRISYENLCADPKGTITRITDFCGFWLIRNRFQGLRSRLTKNR